MFETIYKYELKHWLRQPFVYVFAFLFLIVPWMIMWGMGSEKASRFGGLELNSAYYILRIISYLNVFIYFLLPAIIGASVYRDFKDHVHTVLYSYPFTKRAYLFAKFLSSFTVVVVIVILLGLGCLLGTLMPGVNPALVADFNFWSYVQPYLLFIVPNLVLIGLIVFAVVTMTRNIYAGFVTVVVLILIRAGLGPFFEGMDSSVGVALADPLGLEAMAYYTRYWTVSDKNNLLLPMSGVVLLNRFFWLLIALIIGVWSYIKFAFNQEGISLSKKQDAIAIPLQEVLKVGVKKINYPGASFDFSFTRQIRLVWEMAKVDFRFIVKSPLFVLLLLASLVFIFFSMSLMNPRYDTAIYPMTWLMLKLPAQMYSGVINLITFLFAGLLIHRGKVTKMHQLVDVNPVPNWVLLSAQFIALILMQVVLLGLVFIGGVVVQLYSGFYDIELGHYVFNLYGLNLIHFIIWACMAMFVHSLFNHPYLGFFLLLTAPLGFIMLSHFGPEYLGLHFLQQGIFRYNQGPGEIFGLAYSDMDGYGPILPAYFIHKFYWLLAGLVLLVLTLCVWNRGYAFSFKERLTIAQKRFTKPVALFAAVLLIGFFSIGATIYYEQNVKRTSYSDIERRNIFRQAEQKYKQYKGFVQPKIVDVDIAMNIFPEQRKMDATGTYHLINKSDTVIDTLVLNAMFGLTKFYEFDRTTNLISRDTIADLCQFDLLQLEQPLLPGDSLVMTFRVESESPSWLRTSTQVKSHGTLIKDDVFPRFGNWLGTIRELVHLPTDQKKPFPEDSTALHESYVSKDSDRIRFSATLSTSADQIAIAPGYLKKEWMADGRHYFQYEMAEKIGHSFLFMSGDYGVIQDKWKEVELSVFYHKTHQYNLERMMDGMKAALDYCTRHFSPYQHKALRVVEFSQTGGASAHAFPTTIPTGEEAGFIQHVCELESCGVDVVFGTAVHETAHQWWGHQVIPADVRGAKMIVESMTEYVNLRVKREYKGLLEVHKYLSHNLQEYLKGRNRERNIESPLIYTMPNQNYIHYPKGALVLYALSEYIGEANFNRAIRAYVEEVAFQEEPYTSSIELVQFIRQQTPDSLQYLITDMLETITLYNNQINEAKVKPLENGQFAITIDFDIAKYRSVGKGLKLYSDNQKDSLSQVRKDGLGKHFSLPLQDYIEIGVFEKQDPNGKHLIKPLHLKKYFIQQMANELTIVVDGSPALVVIDPYLKLIDVDVENNQVRL